MLAFGAGMLVIGLATYGYNIMSALGNRLTMHSPSRGFSMEFGAAITVLLASQYAIPVSSTMCIVGATAGVGIVSSGLKGLNYKAFAWIFVSVFTSSLSSHRSPSHSPLSYLSQADAPGWMGPHCAYRGNCRWMSYRSLHQRPPILGVFVEDLVQKGAGATID